MIIAIKCASIAEIICIVVSVVIKLLSRVSRLRISRRTRHQFSLKHSLGRSWISPSSVAIAMFLA